MTPEEKAGARAAKGQARAAKKAERAAARAAKDAAIEARREAARKKKAAAQRAKAEKRHGRQLYKGRWLTRAAIIADIADTWQRTAPREPLRLEPARSSRGFEIVRMTLGTTRAEFVVDLSMAVDARDCIDQVQTIRDGAMAEKASRAVRRAEKKAAEKERQALAIGPPDSVDASEQASCFG